MEVQYSLCPNCDACPEVVVSSDSILIGEEGNQVRLSPGEWNVLVAAVKEGKLGTVDATTGSPADRRDEDCSECCGAAN